jgi:hypothetical protein
MLTCRMSCFTAMYILDTWATLIACLHARTQGQPKVYVQDRLAAAAADVWRLLDGAGPAVGGPLALQFNPSGVGIGEEHELGQHVSQCALRSKLVCRDPSFVML